MKDALLKETKTQLLDLIKVQREVSVDEATEQLNLAKTTVRQHLLLLERQGLIQRSSRKLAKGRPQLVYQLSQSAAQLFPSKDSVLLREILSRLIAEGEKKWVQDFFKDYWQQRFQKFQDLLNERGGKSKEDVQELLLEMLTEEGFMPEIEEHNGTLTVRECNCPFPEAIKATRIPCRLEAQFLKNVLKGDLERVSYIPDGETTCSYVMKMK